MRRLLCALLALLLLSGCQYTHRTAYRQGWAEGFHQADRWHHSDTMEQKNRP